MSESNPFERATPSARDLEIVSELTQRKRGRVFGYQRYVKLLNAESE